MQKARSLLRSPAVAAAGVSLLASAGYLATKKQQQVCLAEEKYKEDFSKIKDLKLIQVLLVARHCARTPLSMLPPHREGLPNYEWTCPPMLATTALPFEELEKENIHYDKSTHPIYSGKHFPEAAVVSYETRVDNKDILRRSKHECMNGQLTIAGMKQCFNFGKEIRDRYLNQAANPYLFLDSIGENDENFSFSAGKIYIRSTDIPTRRTEVSAIYTVMGLFPRSSILTDTLGQRKLQERIRIHLRDRRYETMYPHSHICRRISQLMKEIEKSEDMKKHLSKTLQLVGNKLNQLFNAPPSTDWAELNNTFQTITYDQKPLPKGVTEDDLTTISRLAGEGAGIMFNNPELHRLSIGNFVGELLHEMKKGVKYASGLRKKEPYSMLLYFGHDSTLIPLLCSFNVFNNEWPPFAANVAFELFEDRKNKKEFYVRMVYNGEPLKFADGKELWTFAEFENKAKSLIPKDFSAECKELRAQSDKMKTDTSA